MAKIRGNGGIAKIGTTTIASIKSWSVEETMDPIDATDLATDAKEFVAGETAWTAEVTMMWNQGDTGQAALVVGAEVELHLIRDGDAVTPSDDVNGQAFVTRLGSQGSKNEMVMQNVSLQGTGALTYG